MEKKSENNLPRNKRNAKQSKHFHKKKNKSNVLFIALHTATDESEEIQKKWFEVHNSLLPISTEVADMKDDKLNELHKLCRSAFEQERTALLKKNRKDASWLQTALRKGTAKDSANAGVLLVISNPLANLDALDQLISFTKLSNKASTDVMTIILDMWMNVLLPSHRKLYSLQMRGTDWKILRANESITNEKKREIYAYWYFEAELKERYSEFLKNIQQSLQNGQEINKTVSITAASQLLIFSPEKENLLLTMLINKLGDPIPKVSSKALHHLIGIANKHPNMCPVIVTETEKLLFRNNVSEKAQHMALCYLGSVASLGRTDICIKLVNVCFALFKVLVQKGAVNNRTMQAILRCLQKTIAQTNAIQENGNNNNNKNNDKDEDNDNESKLLSPDMLGTIYRLVHLADIRISIQTLGLLLQLQCGKSQRGDRFYNALYAKLLDVNVATIGMKTAAQFLHIIHRAIHIDRNVLRAKAFIKRLLQLALYVPSNMAAGCLIVVRKLLSHRKELNWWRKNAHTKNTAITTEAAATTTPTSTSTNKEDVNGDDSNNDAETEKAEKAEIVNDETSKLSYNPYHRVPHYSGIQFTINDELLFLRKHFHPTIQVFAENILTNKKIDYYGDPLRDFGLPHFLERFSFKNPKKIDQDKLDNSSLTSMPYAHKYKSIGARGLPVKQLTKANCTEDEMYIFNYLEIKRQKLLMNQSGETSTKHKHDDNDDDDNGPIKANDVSDNEFDEYLNNYFRRKKNRTPKDEQQELDFMKELGDELSTKSAKQRKQTKKKELSDDDIDDVDVDWGDDNNDDNQDSDVNDDEDAIMTDNDDEDNDEDYMSLDEMNDSDLENQSESDSPEATSSGSESVNEVLINLSKLNVKKKRRLASANIDDKTFSKKLKHNMDMRSLFAAADDFGELLEEAGKTKGQGTVNAISNQDKSSEKQLKWEEKRHSIGKKFSQANKKAKKMSVQKKNKVQSRKIK